MKRIAAIPVDRKGRSAALDELVRLLARQAARDYHREQGLPAVVGSGTRVGGSE